MLADDAGQLTPVSVFGINDFGVYRERYKEQARLIIRLSALNAMLMIQRRHASRHNTEFFGAPHVALFMPEVGDNVRWSGDI